MGTLAFDSLQYARRLRAAGVPEQQAEVQAELMAEAFGFYADNIVTRDYLDASLRAAFAEQETRIEVRLAEQDARLEKRFSDQDGRLEKRFAELESGLEKRFVELEYRVEMRFTEQDARLEKRFSDQEVALGVRLGEQEVRFTRGFGELKAQSRLLMLMISGTWLLVGYPLLQNALAV